MENDYIILSTTVIAYQCGCPKEALYTQKERDNYLEHLTQVKMTMKHLGDMDECDYK